MLHISQHVPFLSTVILQVFGRMDHFEHDGSNEDEDDDNNDHDEEVIGENVDEAGNVDKERMEEVD